MKIEYGNYLEMTDDALRRHFNGCDGFVFAAGWTSAWRDLRPSMIFIKSTTSIP